MAKGRSISKISKELETLVDKMKKKAKEFAEADGAKKQKITAELKKMTFDKKMLEKELESAVTELDKNAQLQVDEVRKLIRNVIKEELKKKIAEIEFKSDGEMDDESNDSEPDELDPALAKAVAAGLTKMGGKKTTTESKAQLNESITAGTIVAFAIGLILATPALLKLYVMYLKRKVKTNLPDTTRKQIDRFNQYVKDQKKLASELEKTMSPEEYQEWMIDNVPAEYQISSEHIEKIEHYIHIMHEVFTLPIKKFLQKILGPALRSKIGGYAFQLGANIAGASIDVKSVGEMLKDDKIAQAFADKLYIYIMVIYGAYAFTNSLMHLSHGAHAGTISNVLHSSEAGISGIKTAVTGLETVAVDVKILDSVAALASTAK